MGITHDPQSSMSRVKLVEHSPEKEFCWAASVKTFPKNIMIWIRFLSKVLSCCTLDFPGRHVPDTNSIPGAGGAPRPVLSPQSGQPQACPCAHTAAPAGTEGPAMPVWPRGRMWLHGPLLGPLLWWLFQCINLLQPTVSCIINLSLTYPLFPECCFLLLWFFFNTRISAAVSHQTSCVFFWDFVRDPD